MNIRIALAVAMLGIATTLAAEVVEHGGRITGSAARTVRTDIAFGDDPLQSLSLWRPTAQSPAGTAPLIIFVHGGGWSRGSKDNATGTSKIGHFTAEGYAFASINYRLVPNATVEQQASDVAAAVKALWTDAARLGIDRRRIVLMGHSAGAHLVALVGTDPRYLQGVGLSLSDIAGIIPIDGAAYDVPAQAAQAGPLMRRTYSTAFGSDPARQRALSPIAQAKAPNAPAFLLIHVERPDGIAQNRELAEALRRSGTPVERQQFSGQGLRGHAEINRRLGDTSYPPTTIVDNWLERLFKA